jgi:hypothetical protein
VSEVQQPGARDQYASWLKWPRTYSEPTHEQWAASYDSLAAQLAEARAELAKERGALRCARIALTDWHQAHDRVCDDRAAPPANEGERK